MLRWQVERHGYNGLWYRRWEYLWDCGTMLGEDCVWVRCWDLKLGYPWVLCWMYLWYCPAVLGMAREKLPKTEAMWARTKTIWRYGTSGLGDYPMRGFRLYADQYFLEEAVLMFLCSDCQDHWNNWGCIDNIMDWYITTYWGKVVVAISKFGGGHLCWRRWGTISDASLEAQLAM